MFILFNLLFVSATFDYDSGYFQAFDYRVSGFNCQNGTYNLKQISFNGIFANIPQVILINARLDMENADISYQQQVIFNMSNVTKENFVFFLQCNQRKVWGIKFRWYAFDDKRIEVINQYSISNIQNTTYEHKNPNAIAGFISMLNLGYKGPISFNITITKITSTNVTIQVSDPKSYLANLLTVGFQIVLVPPEYFSIVNTLWTKNVWTSPQIQIVQNTFLMLPFLGFEYDNNHIYRLDTTELTLNPYQYKLDIWGGSDGFYTPNTHQQILFQQTINKTYLPLFCNHFEVIKILDLLSTPSTFVSMSILETNQQFDSIGQYQVVIEPLISIINFVITVNCLETQSIQSQFYIYIIQTEQIQQNSYLHNCSSQYHILTYYSRFIQQTPAVEQLQIEITSNSLNVTQINIYNQYDISNQQLVAIQVI